MASQHLQFRSVLTHAHALVALATAATSFVIAIQYGAFVAGGGDSSGYVSQADLWLKGDLLVEPRPWSEMAEHPRSAWLFCPLGYRPGPVRGTIVPTYSPGLPLMMAAFQAVGGRRAVFWVVPVLAALTVWLTYLFGRGLNHPWAGALGAVLLASSPTFLFQSLQPLVDVPVTFWWLAAIVIARRRGARGAFLAGVAASGALATRPNLVLAVIPFVLYYAGPLLRRHPGRESAGTLMAFLAPVTATAILIAGLHA